MLQSAQTLQQRYQLRTKLGQASGRQTWLADDLVQPTSPSVIVKLLGFVEQVDWQTLKLFEREAKVLQSLDHPRIPKYHDYFSLEDQAFWFGLVQEHIPGNSLRTLLAQGRRFTESEVCTIAQEILEILVYLHEISPAVLHRDIKPSNIIWGDDGHIYLVDFGSVQDQATAPGATFTVVGSYGYTPIEQYGGRAIPASDLYALGSSLIHLITGICPADLPQIQDKIEWHDRVSLNPTLIQWIDKLVEPDSKRRFNTARLALRSLEAGWQHRTSLNQSALKGEDLPPPEFYRNISIGKSPGKLQIGITQKLELLDSDAIDWERAIVRGGIILAFFGQFLGLLSSVFIPEVVMFVICMSMAIAMTTLVNLQYVTWTTNITVYPASVLVQLQGWRRRKPQIMSFSRSVNVFHTCIRPKSRDRRRIITFQTAKSEIFLAGGLDYETSEYLVQEIRDWLQQHHPKEG
jgi:serine/threonine protein kinase